MERIAFMKLQSEKQSFSLILQLTSILLLLGVTEVFSKSFVINSIEIAKDTTSSKKINVIFNFNTYPDNFPVYAMADPERIVVDCPNTKVKEGARPEKTEVLCIKDITTIEMEIDFKPNTRIEIFLKENAFFEAHVSGKQIVLSINKAGDVKKSMSLYRTEESKSNTSTIQSLDVIQREKDIEIALAFSSLPKAATVYKLEKPPRIVMDFYNVFISGVFEKEVNIPPVKKISVVKKDIELPYVGIVVHLEKSMPFYYEQLNGRMVVTIPLGRKKMSKRGKLILISSGVVLTGGVVTGLIMGGDKTGKGADDLGTPPDFPDH